AAHLIGRHDFTTFRSAQCQSDSPVKTLDRLEVSRSGEEIHVAAAARSFLHHQVRSMVGCVAMVGRGQWQVDDIRRALDARDRASEDVMWRREAAGYGHLFLRGHSKLVGNRNRKIAPPPLQQAAGGAEKV